MFQISSSQQHQRQLLKHEQRYEVLRCQITNPVDRLGSINGLRGLQGVAIFLSKSSMHLVVDPIEVIPVVLKFLKDELGSQNDRFY